MYQVVFEIPVNANSGIWIDDLAFVPSYRSAFSVAFVLQSR
jgi:hypothetical protein